MPSLTLTFETVTPLLMNGAEQTPEIRAASFRGVLRYWLRAVLGGIYQNDIEELKKEESRYFGSTEAGTPLRVRVEHRLEPATGRRKYVLPPTVRKQDQRVPMRHSGFNESVRENPQLLRLTLDTHPLRRDTTVFTPQLYAALLLAIHFGAFGKRARRGGGVLQAIKIQADFAVDQRFEDYIRFRANAQSDLIDFFNDRLVPFVNDAQQSSTPPGTLIPSYPVWASDHVKVLVGPTGYDDDPQVEQGKPQPPYHEGYRRALQELWEVSGRLGLHHMRDAWGYGGAGRRASAVHLRVHKGVDGLYYPLVTIMRSGSSDHQWERLETFDQELQYVEYQKLAFCTGVWA